MFLEDLGTVSPYGFCRYARVTWGVFDRLIIRKCCHVEWRGFEASAEGISGSFLSVRMQASVHLFVNETLTHSGRKDV